MSGSPANSPPLARGDEAGPWSRWLTLGCQYVLAVTFLMAALTKITDLSAFRERVVLHSGLPAQGAELVAAYLPWLELTCGACLVLGVMRREAAALLALLLLLFVVQALVRPLEMDCGCLLFLGPSPPASSGWLIARNLLLFCCGIRVSNVLVWRLARKSRDA